MGRLRRRNSITEKGAIAANSRASASYNTNTRAPWGSDGKPKSVFIFTCSKSTFFSTFSQIHSESTSSAATNTQVTHHNRVSSGSNKGAEFATSGGRQTKCIQCRIGRINLATIPTSQWNGCHWAKSSSEARRAGWNIRKKGRWKKEPPGKAWRCGAKNRKS